MTTESGSESESESGRRAGGTQEEEKEEEGEEEKEEDGQEEREEEDGQEEREEEDGQEEREGGLGKRKRKKRKKKKKKTIIHCSDLINYSEELSRQSVDDHPPTIINSSSTIAAHRIDDLLEQLSLTIHCLDESVPVATQEQPLCSIDLPAYDYHLPSDPILLWNQLKSKLDDLFPIDSPEHAQRSISRGVYGLQSFVNFLQHLRLLPAWDDLDRHLEPILSRILQLVIDRCTQPQPQTRTTQVQGSSSSIDPKPSLKLNLDLILHRSIPDLNLISYDLPHSSPAHRFHEELANHQGPISSSNLTTDTSRKRNSTTVAQKLKVIDYHHQTKSTQKRTAQRFGLTQSQLSRWLKEEEELRDYLMDKGSSSKRQRTGDFPLIEETLLRYVIEAKARNHPCSDDALKERTKSFMRLYQVSHHALKVSNGWLLRFKSRNHVKSYQPLPHSSLPSDWHPLSIRDQLRQLTDPFALRDIYTVAQVELFCSLDSITGSRDRNLTELPRLTYLLCTNSDGSDKRTPLVVGRSREPQAFKSKVAHKPYWYRYSTRGRISSPIFAEWIKKFDRDLQRQNRRVLLLIDSSKRFVCDLESITSTVIYSLPSPSTQGTQPLYSGIIQTFKSNYRLNLMEIRNQTLDLQAEKILLEHEQNRAMECAQAAWDQITPTTIKNCFNHTEIISARSEDGRSISMHQPSTSNHIPKHLSDLDMEKSLMATQSALIQLQRDLLLPESLQLSIEDFLDLEALDDHHHGRTTNRFEPDPMPTDHELVDESKFHSTQVTEELQHRKHHEAYSSSKMESRSPPGLRSDVAPNFLPPEDQVIEQQRPIKPKPKTSKSFSTHQPSVELEAGLPALSSSSVTKTISVSNSNPPTCHHANDTTLNVPLSVQQMIRNLEQLEYSLPFYLNDQTCTSHHKPEIPDHSDTKALNRDQKSNPTQIGIPNDVMVLEPLQDQILDQNRFPIHGLLQERGNPSDSPTHPATENPKQCFIENGHQERRGLGNQDQLPSNDDFRHHQSDKEIPLVDDHHPTEIMRIDDQLRFIRHLKSQLRQALTRPNMSSS